MGRRRSIGDFHSTDMTLNLVVIDFMCVRCWTDRLDLVELPGRCGATLFREKLLVGDLATMEPCHRATEDDVGFAWWGGGDGAWAPAAVERRSYGATANRSTNSGALTLPALEPLINLRLLFAGLKRQLIPTSDRRHRRSAGVKRAMASVADLPDPNQWIVWGKNLTDFLSQTATLNERPEAHSFQPSLLDAHVERWSRRVMEALAGAEAKRSVTFCGRNLRELWKRSRAFVVIELTGRVPASPPWLIALFLGAQ